MAATVINLNLQETPGLPEGAVYIGRAHMGRRLPASKFANPFPLQDRSSDSERKVILERYHDWLWQQIQADVITVTDLQELDGKCLACFCAPQPCHGMVLVNAVEWAMGQKPGQNWKGVSNPIEMPRVRTLSDWLKPRR